MMESNLINVKVEWANPLPLSSIHENSNGFTCVWTFCSGDDEEDVAMWEEQLVSSAAVPPPPSWSPEDEQDGFNNVPARGPSSFYSDEEVEQHVRTSVSSALARARKRHSDNLEKRRSSFSLSPRAKIQKSPTTRSPNPRRLKVRKSMAAALSPLVQNMDI